jgi:hypothetical protein
MRRLISCFLLPAALFAVGIARGESINVEVDSRDASWLDSGLDVLAGQTLTINASGTATLEPGNLLTWCTFPDGVNGRDDGTRTYSDCLLPSAIAFSIVAKIGGTTAIGTGTPVPEDIAGKGAGFVGWSYTYDPMPVSGRLFFAFNDRPGEFSDNIGFFDVTASVVGVPEPSTFALLGIGATGLFGYGWRWRKQIA